jgi:acetyl esterase
MPVLPALRPLFEALTKPSVPRSPAPIVEARAGTHAMMERHILGFYPALPPLRKEVDHVVPVAGGVVAVRLYYPDRSTDQPFPCHIYFHGGGFWLGTLDHFAPLCRGLAEEAACVVASVAYRLAPEHKFPVPLEDSYAALLWIAAHATKLGIDAQRLSVGGVSAGGNLAAVVAILARDRGGPKLALQVLEVPIADLTDLAPLDLPAEGLALPTGKETYIEHYLSDPAQAADPRVSPVKAQDFQGLPPALILTAEYDPLVRDGQAYANRLAAAGVAVEYHCSEGQFHGSQPMAALIPEEAAAYQSRIAEALQRAWREL